jgi:lipid II:glycine glycyltransferase (peptidoglycan interpeptide bridge formation enzyme)
MRARLETVWSARLGARDARDYDDFVTRAHGTHYAQSAAWARVATAGRARAARFFLARRDGRVVGAALVVRPGVGGIVAPVALVDRGPVCDDVGELEEVMAALRGAAVRRGVVRVSAMPYWAGDDAARAEIAMKRAGFHDVQELDGAHACTLRVDVGGKNDDAILAGSDRKKLRYELKSAEKAAASVRRGGADDVGVLARLDAALAASQGRRARDAWFAAIAAYLREDAGRGAVLVCEHEGAAVSAVLVLRHARTAVYCAGASILEQRPFSKTALPLVEAARWARDAGCDTFDLGGVPLEGDRDPKRAAIAQFKRDFSKTPVALVREHARWL